MRLNDPKGDQFRGLKRFPRNLAAGSPLGYTSVSKGQTQFIGLLSLLVEGSGLVTGLWDVDGELRIGGELNGSGEFTWTGPVNLVGDTEVSGDFDIITGGIFRAGNLTITPGGNIVGASGLILNPNGNLAVQGSMSTTGAANFGDLITVAARLTASGDVYMDSLPTKTGTGLLAGLLWRDPATGRIHRITS